jgi:hypothetical protein
MGCRILVPSLPEFGLWSWILSLAVKRLDYGATTSLRQIDGTAVVMRISDRRNKSAWFADPHSFVTDSHVGCASLYNHRSGGWIDVFTSSANHADQVRVSSFVMCILVNH